MKQSKGKKTTTVAIISGILGLSVFGMWYFEKIETGELMVALIAVSYLATMLTGYLAKDSTSSHTFNLKSKEGGGAISPDKGM